MVLADNMDESVDDITAAETAPRPKKATHCGVKYRKQSGSMSLNKNMVS